ncbi:hypothetical protein ACFWM5_00455 [Streptomyces bobili]|uniref:hypothetical protein n=1 Tax=Streptomyces bobili TaxID=67280 RepID=UPI00364C7DD3
MTYNLAPTNAPWFEHLTDSVDALGEAAREWQLAASAAEVAHSQMDPMRRVLHDGKVTGQPGPDAVGWNARPFRRSPHSAAVYELQRLYLDARQRTRVEYEHAALLYVSGAAWAIGQVRAGAQPTRAMLPAEDDGRKRALVPGNLDAGVEDFKADRYSKARLLEDAYDRLLECLAAGRQAEDIGDQEYVSERDDAEAAECSAIAEGTADAAYAYGRLLREALGFVLLGPRQARLKQLAEQQAAERANQEQTPGGEL